MPSKRKIPYGDADDETRLSQIRGVGSSALQRLAGSGLIKNFDPKMTLSQFRSSNLTYKHLQAKGVKGAVWKGILGGSAGASAPPLQRPSAGGQAVSTDNPSDTSDPNINPLLAPKGEGNPTIGDPQQTTHPGETPEVLAQQDQPDISGAKAVPTGLLAGGQATPCVIPDVQLNLTPGDSTIHSILKPAIELQYPTAPAAALGPQQGIVASRQVDAESHLETVSREAGGVSTPATTKADGSGDIGDDGKGSLALENESQKRIDQARRGFRSVPITSGLSSSSSDKSNNPPGSQQPPQQQQQQQPQQLSEPYRQQSLFRDFDSRISGSKLVRSRATKLARKQGALIAADSIRATPSFDTYNPYTQGIRSWADPVSSSSNFLDRTSEILSLQYYGSQPLMNVYDPCPMIVEASGFGFR